MVISQSVDRRTTRDRQRAHGLARWSLWAPMSYVFWFWVALALATSLTDSVGEAPWIGVVTGTLLTVPNWVGAWAAARARQLGEGMVAPAALWMNLAMGVALTTWATQAW